MEHMSVRRKENFYCVCRVRGRMAVGKATKELGEHSPSAELTSHPQLVEQK